MKSSEHSSYFNLIQAKAKRNNLTIEKIDDFIIIKLINKALLTKLFLLVIASLLSLGVIIVSLYLEGLFLLAFFGTIFFSASQIAFISLLNRKKKNTVEKWISSDKVLFKNNDSLISEIDTKDILDIKYRSSVDKLGNHFSEIYILQKSNNEKDLVLLFDKDKKSLISDTSFFISYFKDLTGLPLK